MSEKRYLVLTTNALWMLVKGTEKCTLRKIFNVTVPPPDETKILEGQSIGWIPDALLGQLRLFKGEEPDKPYVTLNILSTGDGVPLIGDCDNEITKTIESANKKGKAITKFL